MVRAYFYPHQDRAMCFFTRIHDAASGELPLTFGRLKAKGCEVDLSGNQQLSLSPDVTHVKNEPKLDLGDWNLKGAQC